MNKTQQTSSTDVGTLCNPVLDASWHCDDYRLRQRRGGGELLGDFRDGVVVQQLDVVGGEEAVGGAVRGEALPPPRVDLVNVGDHLKDAVMRSTVLPTFSDFSQDSLRGFHL